MQCMRDVKGLSVNFGEGQNGAAQKHMAMKTQAETEKQQAQTTSALNYTVVRFVCSFVQDLLPYSLKTEIQLQASLKSF